jgi:hypothetical protein
MSTRIDWQAAPCIFVRRITCPVCGTAERGIIVRSEREHAEVRRRYVCRACSSPYVVILADDEGDDVSSF